MRHSEIIERLGGIGPVAARTGRHRTRVSVWRRAGIPSEVWPEIIALAQERRVRGITAETLLTGLQETGPVPPLPRGRRPRSAAPQPQPQQVGAD